MTMSPHIQTGLMAAHSADIARSLQVPVAVKQRRARRWRAGRARRGRVSLRLA